MPRTDAATLCTRLLLGVAVVTALWPGVAGAQSDGVTFTVSVDDRPVTDVDANEPLILGPEEALVDVEVANASDQPIRIRSMRLVGDVAGLRLFSYSVRMDLRLEPGDREGRSFLLDLDDLAGQATGLLPAGVELLDADRAVVASQSFPVDVRGRLASVYGVFGLTVAAATALVLLNALVRLATHRLPANRWQRAIRFAAPGVGVGLTLTFTLSALRVLIPSTAAWSLLLLAGAAVGFGFGYLTPAPAEEEEAEELIVLDEQRTIRIPDSQVGDAPAARSPIE